MSAKTLITAEELAKLPDNYLCELVDGEIVELSPTKDIHGFVAANTHGLLYRFNREGRLGITSIAEAGFLLRRNPDTVRVPNVSVISRERVRQTGLTGDYWPFAPDLAVEVISPDNTVDEIDQKVQEYLSAGSRLIWVISPRNRTVMVYLPDGSAQVLRADDTLTGGDVLPGFSVRVEELFAQDF